MFWTKRLAWAWLILLGVTGVVGTLWFVVLELYTDPSSAISLLVIGAVIYMTAWALLQVFKQE